HGHAYRAMQYHWLLTHHWLGLIALWRVLLWILRLSILRLPILWLWLAICRLPVLLRLWLLRILWLTVLRLWLTVCRLPILWLLLLRIIRLTILCRIRRLLWWVLPGRHRARLCYRGSCAGRGSKRATAI